MTRRSSATPQVWDLAARMADALRAAPSTAPDGAGLLLDEWDALAEEHLAVGAVPPCFADDLIALGPLDPQRHHQPVDQPVPSAWWKRRHRASRPAPRRGGGSARHA